MQRRCGIVKTKGELGTSSGRRETRFHPTRPPPPSRPLKTLVRRGGSKKYQLEILALLIIHLVVVNLHIVQI